MVGGVHADVSVLSSDTGAVGVLLTGYILDTTSSWSLVLCGLAGTNMIGLVSYLLYGSTDRLQLVDS